MFANNHKTKFMFFCNRPFVFIVLCIFSQGMAQTVNVGELNVLAGTLWATIGDFQNNNSGTFINDGETIIYGDFTNSGIVDFSNGTQGRFRFEGNTEQRLLGTSPFFFYDVQLNNPTATSAYVLANAVSIANQVEFINGILEVEEAEGLVVFENNATAIGASDLSHIDGEVQKNGDDPFNYPIGNQQSFRFAAISAPEDINASFSGRYYLANPVGITINGETPTQETSVDIALLNENEFWTITKNGGTADVVLTLSWDENTTTPLDIVTDPESAIRILRWDENGQRWINEGGIIDSTNKTVTTPIRLNAYGIFTLGRATEELVTNTQNDVPVFNFVSPNGDGHNDYLYIETIEDLVNNRLEVFNRWGVQVFATNDYDTNGNVFEGFSNTRSTFTNDNPLPTGTYYYILSYDVTIDGRTERIKKTDFLYLTSN